MMRRSIGDFGDAIVSGQVSRCIELSKANQALIENWVKVIEHK